MEDKPLSVIGSLFLRIKNKKKSKPTSMNSIYRPVSRTNIIHLFHQCAHKKRSLQSSNSTLHYVTAGFERSFLR